MNITKENALQYSELLKAYAEGKTIQMCTEGFEDWTDLDYPKFGANIELYRVKPEAKTMKYRLYWWKIIPCGEEFSGNLEPETITEEQYSKHMWFEDESYFGGWISDWIEIEVPEVKE